MRCWVLTLVPAGAMGQPELCRWSRRWWSGRFSSCLKKATLLLLVEHGTYSGCTRRTSCWTGHSSLPGHVVFAPSSPKYLYIQRALIQKQGGFSEESLKHLLSLRKFILGRVLGERPCRAALPLLAAARTGASLSFRAGTAGNPPPGAQLGVKIQTACSRWVYFPAKSRMEQLLCPVAALCTWGQTTKASLFPPWCVCVCVLPPTTLLALNVVQQPHRDNAAHFSWPAAFPLWPRGAGPGGGRAEGGRASRWGAGRPRLAGGSGGREAGGSARAAHDSGPVCSPQCWGWETEVRRQRGQMVGDRLRFLCYPSRPLPILCDCFITGQAPRSAADRCHPEWAQQNFFWSKF